MRFPDVLVEFKRLEERQRLLDMDIRALRAQMIRIEGAGDYIGTQQQASASVEDTHITPPRRNQ